jgi:hypothetical protein
VEEMALVYFHSDKARDPKGWLFLKDITEIEEDGNSFKLVTVARYFSLIYS